MVPTIEEFEEILGCPLGGRKPYLFSGFLPSLSKVAAVIEDSAKELDCIKQVRNDIVGLPRKYLEDKARDMASQEKWGPFADDPNVTSKTPIDIVLEEIEVRKEVEVEAMEEEVPPQEQLVELDQVVGAQRSKLSTLPVNKVVFKLDESYTPSKVSIRASDGFHNLKEIKTVELVKPTGWVYLSLSGADPS
ncbi:uncharacterized protein [Glycine max]|uniref:uncharacterized protein n=1 Tax=Glycine max TaxID=3847 RepID=UPI001B356D83|nr:uncharacterized protein LOC121173677 [Glycine max]